MTRPDSLLVTPPWGVDPVSLPVGSETGHWWVSTGLSTNAVPPPGNHERDHRWGFATSPATRVAHPTVSAAWDAAAAWFAEQTRAVQIRRLFTRVDLAAAPLVDLTDPHTQSILGVTDDVLTAQDPSACQYLGHALWNAGATILKVPTPTDDRVAILITHDAPGVTILTSESTMQYSPAGWPVVPAGKGTAVPGSSYVQLVTAQHQNN